MKEIEKGGGMLVEREKIHVKRQESASAWGDLDSGRDRILCGEVLLFFLAIAIICFMMYLLDKK